MIKIIRTNSENEDFRELVKLLDKELAERDGDAHPFYAQYNKIDKIKYAVVAYLGNFPVGCGAIKDYSEKTVEVKRMYVLTANRSQGIGAIVLRELEKWAEELNFSELILETGKAQPEAIRLYSKSGYSIIPNYGQYEGIDNSVCMKKSIL
ncbi:MAG TPA: GNAT family N-acetyltransferase [Ignavibacteriaceae bacterium]|nr:GNAT family N-acetyltransferase [Ignavibacteriaceae bacterium]